MLKNLLQRVIRVGHLTVRFEGGQGVIEAGQPLSDGPQPNVAVLLKGTLTPLKLVLNPDLYLGEAYMDGDLAIERGTLWDLMDLIGRNLANRSGLETHALGRAVRNLHRRMRLAISPVAARRNVHHHYDLSEALYRGFLDPDLQYSCAYFSQPDMSLAAAQEAKKRHIISKLLLEPGHRVLDIGCGWGGLALEIAKVENVRVTGITLSSEQLKVCRERASHAGLDHRVNFELLDYREINRQFDRIVSVGMFEHVGPARYPAFFRSVRDLLVDDGVALLHSIGRRTPPAAIDPWIDKFIFPGGYIPALSEVTGAIEPTGLWITDVEILRLHYAETLKRWRERFMDPAFQASNVYDERFQRMWEFYLAGSEMGFRYADLMVFQAQIAKQVATVPITRDYMLDEERARASPPDVPAPQAARISRRSTVVSAAR